MKGIRYFVFSVVFILSCQSQNNRDAGKLIGGPCEGCEAIHEYGTRELTSSDTLPKFMDTEPKIIITGTIYKNDGKTPADGVILYAYHTNREGIYETRGNEKGWARRHGYIRGWIKSGKDGTFSIYTFRPGAYPGRTEPEHIHLTVKEPGINEYYIDDILFRDDSLLSPAIIKRRENRGGSGIVLPVLKDGILHVKRDIVLGLNIPGYKRN